MLRASLTAHCSKSTSNTVLHAHIKGPLPVGHLRGRPCCCPRVAVPLHRRHTTVVMSGSKKELQSLPGVCSSPDAATKDFILQQTMLRIKDPKPSLDFYTRVLGMTLLAKLDFPDMSFTLYFLGYEDPADIPEDPRERAVWMFGLKGTLELTHNWGTEDQPDFKYHNGNSEPRGFGHIGLAVPDVYAAAERFEKLGVEFVKRPDDGKMKGLAFIKDPDGYWIEILNPKASGSLASA